MTIAPPNNNSVIDSSLVADLSAPSRPRILVVDDQPINIQVLHQIFSADHDVFMATSGEQALVVCRNQQPDIILLDIEMPGMDGYQVCEAFKADSATQDIPVIFITAHIDAVAEEHGLDVGAVDFISKPLNPKIVRARVKTHLTLKMQSDILRSWAYLDSLTTLHNRRYFDERLGEEWARAMRYGTELSLVMIDVDFFKRYNDHYGHMAGDSCLHQVGAVIKTSMKRPGDLAARYGGEEFVCLLPNTGAQGAVQFAEFLRQQIFALQIEHANSAISPFVTASLWVCTKSTGVSGASGAQGSAEELLRQADGQLYEAKNAGRNQVCGSVFSL